MQTKIAPSLGELEGKANDVWGTSDYDNQNSDTVFFGLYGLPDFYTLWRHRGKKYILWAGTDIVHFTKGYWLDELGSIRVNPEPLAEWIEENCESWVENEVQKEMLEDAGITARVCPSFMGNVNEYELSYNHSQRPKVYLSVSGDNFDMYGWNIIEQIADKCTVDFHLYGNKGKWESKHSNVFVHGRVSKEQMNEEIKNMQSGLRLCMPDGFSEILAKSVLWGQWPITWSSYKYPHILGANGQKELIRLINSLEYKKEPNREGREYYIKNINQYPWKTK